MTARERGRARLGALVEFFAPAPLLAVAVLAVNDHLLKARLHNGLTGKLSDVTLCFFLPLYLSALLGLVAPALSVRRRLDIGAVTTVLAFTVLELSDVAGILFAKVIRIAGAPLGLGPVMLTRDLTDLLTVALVPVAWWYGHLRTRRAAGARSNAVNTPAAGTALVEGSA